MHSMLKVITGCVLMGSLMACFPQTELNRFGEYRIPYGTRYCNNGEQGFLGVMTMPDFLWLKDRAWLTLDKYPRSQNLEHMICIVDILDLTIAGPAPSEQRPVPNGYQLCQGGEVGHFSPTVTTKEKHGIDGTWVTLMKQPRTKKLEHMICIHEFERMVTVQWRPEAK